MFCVIAVPQAAAREQSDSKNSGVRWRLYAGSWWLLLLLLTPTVHTLQTFVAVLGWICGHNIAIRCLPRGLAPGQHLSQIIPTLSFLSGVCGATFCPVLWSNFPSENLPGANWPQHIKSFTFISFFGSSVVAFWLSSQFWVSLFSKPHPCLWESASSQWGVDLCPSVSRTAIWGGLGFQFLSLLEFWTCPARRWPPSWTQEWRDSVCHLSLGESRWQCVISFMAVENNNLLLSLLYVFLSPWRRHRSGASHPLWMTERFKHLDFNSTADLWPFSKSTV